MRIPSRFKLFNQTITVTSRAEDFIEHNDWCGIAQYRTNEIQLNPMMNYKTKEQIEHTFVHELVHFILYYSQDTYKPSEDELMHQQEAFVDLTALLLHQAICTMEYDEDQNGKN